MSLDVRNLHFAYDGEPVLKGVNVEFSPGCNVILGPNAAGKSTLLKCLCGELHTRDNIFYEGEPLARLSNEKLTGMLSYLPQDTHANIRLSVLELVLLGKVHTLSWHLQPEDIDAAYKCLVELGIEELAQRNLNELSGGQQKMVAIAQSLVKNPGVLVLDEPTNSLDLRHQFEVFDVIRKITRDREIIVIMALHDLNMAARYADKVVVLHDGLVYNQGKPKEVVTAGMMEEVYRINAEISACENGQLTVTPIEAVR